MITGNKQLTKKIKQNIKRMTMENASKLWHSTQKARDYF